MSCSLLQKHFNLFAHGTLVEDAICVAAETEAEERYQSDCAAFEDASCEFYFALVVRVVD
ncbi:MAG: hypothetical protein EOP04_13380 [Proteobacteria bacterium]|nr:MAG: hypothetical protein EOP04_13380 [Pseudomonadota bacterium]